MSRSAHPSLPSRARRRLRRQPLPPRLTALVVLVVPMAMTLFSWQQLRHIEQQQASAAFSREASRVSAAMEERLNDYAQVLRGGSGFLHATPNPSRQAWHQFSEQLELSRKVPGMLVLGYLPRVAAADLPAFTQRMREREGVTGFSVRPPGPRDEYYPVAFMAPEAPLRSAFGFDVASEPTRREVLQAARDMGVVAMSGPIRLMADPEHASPSLLMVAPLYSTNGVPTIQEQRRQALQGYVFTLFRVDEFVDSLSLSGSAQLNIRISDDSGGSSQIKHLYGASGSGPSNPLSEERSFYFGGRSWQLHLESQDPPEQGPELPSSRILLFSGTAISMLLALLTLRLGSRRSFAEQLARRLSHEWAEANSRLTGVFAALPDLMFELDRDRCFRHYHAPNEGELFVPPHSFLGRHPRDILPASLVTQLEQCCDRIDAGVRLQIMEYQLPRHDGEIGEYEARITAIGEGGYLMVVRNVSEVRRTQQALLQANTRMKSVFDSATEVSIITTDTEGLITVFNRGAEKMLGYSAAAMVGQATPAILHLPEEVEARAAELSREFGWKIQGFEVFVTRARLTGAERREWTYVRQDGSHLTVSLVVTAVYDEAHNVTGFLGVAVDITALKTAEAELRRHRDHLQELVSERSADLLVAKEAAEYANHTKSEFLANMSHELRTPMHAILSFAGLGLSRAGSIPGAEKLNHYFQRIRESGERLLALVNDLLDLSKLEAGKMSFEPRPVNLRPLIREAAGEMESLLQEKSLHLVLDERGPAEVYCDPLRFGQLIRNLLSNAIKFSPVGGVIQVGFAPTTLSSGRRSGDRGNRSAVEMTVRDEGVGIPVDERELVFDKFAQSSKTKTGAGGTGLGLAICREIALAHRGTIVARGNDGPGTCLAVTLPTPEASPSIEDRA